MELGAGGRRTGTGGKRAIWGRRLTRKLSTIRADLSLALIETGLIAVSYAAAMSLRFIDAGDTFPTVWWTRLAFFLPVIIVVHLTFNVVFGNYGHVWSYASIEEALRVVAAGTATGFVLVGIVGLNGWLTEPPNIVPMSVVILGVLLTLAGMGGLRFWSRLFSKKRASEHRGRLQRGLVVGVGSDAVYIVRNHRDSRAALDVVGFVDPEPGTDRSRMLAGRPVLGAIDDVPEIVQFEDIDQIIIACPDADQIGRLLVDTCMDIDVRLRIFPAMDSILTDARAPRDIRDLELADLLPRQQVETDLTGVASFLHGRRVLVTGAGGSIGSEIVRQVLGFDTEAVIAVDHDETHLHDAFDKWNGPEVTASLTIELADIRDPDRIAALFDEHKPHVVFHAAAHKHVPILETCPDEAIKTNVIGTANVIEAAANSPATEGFVLISTDKAVRPESVMGASKRIAEMMVQKQAIAHEGVKWSAVRFGNVLGSRGSVVPTFKRQVQAGGPVTVSHPDMERYFMTVDEAVELVLQAASISAGGEVFVLDMGLPVRIMDLANRIIRLAGLVPGKDIEVVITGTRPGERLSEELSIIPLSPSSHPKILLARPSISQQLDMKSLAETMERLLDLDGVPQLRQTLLELANERGPEASIVDLTQYEGERAVATGTGS